ncbi:hypothetical protein JRO89_XS05G0262200 [Xanthoceras sorbifolium]|uniref:Pentatricopeptide repeat-containing protein n=1 Tax=Xanthoceras sorbifolium TaxID=99658 RepID=A0ABQ8I408_9ROSI|nr:hypothetical protein JRO89_XS05G0262200 [Xanthoceras sorbifolium]
MINGYISCGDIASMKCLFELAPERDVRKLFDQMLKKDVISWNMVLCGYANNEDVKECERMLIEGRVFSNDVTLMIVLSVCARLRALDLGVLFACTHMSLIEDGLSCFQSMVNDYSIVPQIEHYGCMVDLLARASCLAKAIEFIKKMPIEAYAVTWANLLAACRVYKNVELAKLSLQRLIELEPKNPANFILLSNIYEDLRRWKVVFREMVERNVVTWTAMINGYISCCDIASARCLFELAFERNEMLKKDVISWITVLSVMRIMGTLRNVRVLDALKRMVIERRVFPNDAILAIVLSVWARLKALNLGKLVHVDAESNSPWSMIIQLCLKLSTMDCMVDLLARVYKNVELAELALQRLMELEPNNPTNFAMLSNIYGDLGRWKDMARAKVAMGDIGFKKLLRYTPDFEVFDKISERRSTARTAASNCRGAPQAADDVKKPLVNCPCSVSVVSPPLPTRQFVLTALQILRFVLIASIQAL